MIEYITMVIVFVSLYTAILWTSFLLLNLESTRRLPKEYPSVTIAIPAYNEEAKIEKTIRSVASLDYPKEKLEIIVIDDGSKDKTVDVARRVAKEYSNVYIYTKRHEGKASALNYCLKRAKGTYFSCVDADSTVERESLKLMLHHFKKKRVAAVTTAIQVHEPKNFYEKIQRIEYMLGVVTRKLMATINTLAMTPGVLSVYRKDVLMKIGGFDENSKTEDFEIAMRLKYHGYKIELETNAHTYTTVPKTFLGLWRQRLRWFRGFIYYNLKYRKMLMNKRYGAFGFFQMPFNIIGIFLLIAMILIMSYGFVKDTYYFIMRSILIDGYFKNTILSVTTPKEFLLEQNMKLTIPIIFASIIGLYILYVAHKITRQKIKNPAIIWAYFFIFPFISFLHWVVAIAQEVLRVNKKW
ncbi:MAG: glycosyltransferase family 2 protein [Candidatus Woesearchaeota archaeon]